MSPEQRELDRLCADTIRFLAADGVQKANSGHPGMPMGAADMAFALWDRHLKHNPTDPRWPDRDRFVLSAGHGSMLLYALLHLTGYDLPMAEIQSFRQWGSKTPGHPEYDMTPGVEATTGPLGQGIANAVGMALAEAHLAARFNRPGHTIVDHHTYAIASDGDLMEGVAAEACSLAGHLGLGKLIVLHDDNLISLAASVEVSSSEDVGRRFEAYGWQVIAVEDGNSVEAVDAAITEARSDASRPSILNVRTVIGYGSPKFAGTCKAHGAPLGEGALAEAKENLGWPVERAFHVPVEALAQFRRALTHGKARQEAWTNALHSYAAEYPDLGAELSRRLEGKLPEGWDSDLPAFEPDPKGIATRKASGKVLNAIAKKLPELVGGSADLNPSTNTVLEGEGDFQRPGAEPKDKQGVIGDEWGYGGRNVHFGVREHAMGSISVGMALHGGLIPYTATFLTFVDYMRPPMRMAALSGLQTIHVFTHDSIGLGEDGPTHQPIEQIMNLRCVPRMTVIRPADASEVVEAWKAAIMNQRGPTTLIFTRQNLPTLDRTKYAPASGLHRGAYILWRSGDGAPDVILIGTGSEVSVVLEAGAQLAEDGVSVSVVAMPSWELFDRQDVDYRRSVLPLDVRARIAVEAGTRIGWERYVGLDGAVIGMDTFGASAPAGTLFEKFGITAQAVVRAAKILL